MIVDEPPEQTALGEADTAKLSVGFVPKETGTSSVSKIKQAPGGNLKALTFRVVEADSVPLVNVNVPPLPIKEDPV